MTAAVIVVGVVLLFVMAALVGALLGHLDRAMAAAEERLRAEQEEQRRILNVQRRTLQDHAEALAEFGVLGQLGIRKPVVDGDTLPLPFHRPTKED